nr:transposase [Gracilibacillus boraciitolerans]
MRVFDRGYYNFEKFDAYCDDGFHFVTRIKNNTIVQVIEEVPIDPASSIIREAVVKIGKMKHPLRLIETRDSEGNQIRIVCNDAKRSALEISDLYRKKWQIELFFKSVKQHLVLKKLYGKSQNAVFNQIYIAMIVFCLTLLIKHHIGYQGSLLEMLDWLKDYWCKQMKTFLAELSETSDRISSGRQKMGGHQRIYEESLAQYERGDAFHLDDVTYVPSTK